MTDASRTSTEPTDQNGPTLAAVIDGAIAKGGLDVRARGAATDDGPLTLRNILLNMIEEYARHNGHADLIRESIDGMVGHDPPGQPG